MTNDDSNKPLEAVGDEALEARIVAWVLGEASAFEASELEELCRKDPEAALFARRMRMLDGLIRDKDAEALKLSEEKRAKVLEVVGGKDRARPVADGRSRRDRGRAVRRRLLAIAAVLVLLVILGGLSAPMVLRQRKAVARMESPIVSYSARDGEMVDLMMVAESEARARGKASLPEELIEGTPRPIRLPGGELANAPKAESGAANILTGGLRSGDAAVTRDSIDAILNSPQRVAELEKKADRLPEASPELEREALAAEKRPSAPSSNTAGPIAASRPASPAQLPEIETRSVDAFAANGTSDGGGGGGGGGVMPELGDAPSLGRLFDQKRGQEGNVRLSDLETGQGGSLNLYSEENANGIAPGGGSVDQSGVWPADGQAFATDGKHKESGDLDGFVNYGSPVQGEKVVEGPAMDPFAPADGSETALKARKSESDIASKDEENGRKGGIEGEVHVGQHNMYEFRFVDIDDKLGGTREGGERSDLADVDNAVDADPFAPADDAALGLERSLGERTEVPVDAERTNPAITDEHRGNVDEVRRKLYEGGGNYDLGKFDEAKEAYEDVLRIDPYNSAARRGMEKVNAAKSDYYKAAYDHTRAELLSQVDAAWEEAVPADPAGDRNAGAESAAESAARAAQAAGEAARDAPGEGGYTEERQALSVAQKYAELETQKIKLESQIDTLLKYDGEQMVNYAAGLNLPENTIKSLHPGWLEAKRKLESAKLRGLGAEHPEVRRTEAEVARLNEQMEEGVTELREKLRSQLDLVSEQSERLALKKDKEEAEAVTHGIARYSFDDAKADLETSQSLLEKLKVKLVGEEMQRRISEDPVVVHQDPVAKGPGLLSLDRRYEAEAVVQVRPAKPSIDVLPGYVSKDPTAGSSTFFPTEFEVVKSRKTLEEAIKSANLSGKTGKPKEQLIQEIEKNLEVDQVKGTDLMEIRYKDRDKQLTKEVVEAVTDAYRKRRKELESQRQYRAMQELREAVRSQEDLVEEKRKVLTQLIRNEGVVYSREPGTDEERQRIERELQILEEAAPKSEAALREERNQALDLMAEVPASEEPFSTFSLHVSDASFKLALSALERGERPDPEGIRPEEFYNAFDYGDPAPSAGEPVACVLEQAAHPAFPQRNLLRVAVRTGAAGRAQSVPLNLTLLLDNSGSMERADRSEGVARAVDQLSSLLKPGDKVTVAGFSRTPRLLADRLDGGQAAQLNDIVRQVPAEGGTNLEQALVLGEELATRQFVPGAQNRMVLFTDGAANLGDADPESLNTRVEQMRQNGIAFDAAGFGADGLNDRLLERLTRNGNGRYYVVDEPDEADEGFADKLAGAFRPAAENVKVQVVFNPERVGRYKLIGFEEHRLKKEDFRDDTVDAAEMAAEEAGVALYQMEVLPEGEGEIGEVRVRFRDAASGAMVERSWTIPYEPDAPGFDQASESLQLAGLAAFTAEKLRDAPMAGVVDFGELAPVIGRVAAKYSESGRVAELRRMIETLR